MIIKHECKKCGAILTSDSVPEHCVAPCDSTEFFLISVENGNSSDLPTKNYTQEDAEKARKSLVDCYEKILYAYDHYLDWDIREIKLQSIWVIGTYFFRNFPAYPYKFINAMKGSGKTRLLKLTEAIAYNGKLTTGMSDSAMFRSAADSTLLFDEAENITSKEKKDQRLMLNSGYKRGASIQLSKEKYVQDGQTKVKSFVVESYPVYCPKMLANIWGMEEVLGDRCITSIMEKSNNPIKTKLIEDFDINPFFSQIKRTLTEASSVVTCVRCSILEKGNKDNNIIEQWNSYIFDKYTNLHTTYYNNIIHNTTLTIEYEELFNAIETIGLDGRYLELFFPLFIVAKTINNELLREIIEIAKWKVSEKKDSEMIESIDISVFSFVSQQDKLKALIFTRISTLVADFKSFFEGTSDNVDWINAKWFGRALVRLNLITKKRRLGQGIEVVLNIAKAREKLKIFDNERKEIDIM